MSRIGKLRKYQIEALKAIEDELIVNNASKCLVKMFCGTGKSAIMRNFQASQDVNLIVYIFPSLSLISQFTHDYLKKEETPILKISSDDNSTTEPYIIQNFLSKLSNKIICVTYQSFATLIENLNGLIIDVCIFDEAHHAVGQTYKQLIFKDCEHSNKQIFFTATPKNANGIVMYEKDLISDCGKMVYDYTYYRGITEEYLNPFEIRLDFYTENNNHSIYESICRSILASGNNRVLTFHSDVNTDRDTSVNNFVNQLDLDRAFNKILNEEFSDKIGFYTKVKIVGLSSEIISTCPQCLEKIKKSTHRQVAKSCCRYNILENFDKTKDNEILIISSCETIGEGIDTKNANMCVFVDPKSSYVSIMQNIGRIVRKNGDRPSSTILIPCWVDREKYLNCNGDKEKCDEAIREDLGTQGNFNNILNVMSALRQEDEELYDICLHYQDTYSPQEIQTNLEKQGFTIKELVGEGNLIENVEYLLDEELDYENYEDLTDEEILLQIASEHGVNIEVHTNSLEMPIEKYILSNELEDEESDDSTKTIRLYKTIDEETEEIVYSPIVEKKDESEKKQSVKPVSALDRNKRMNVKVHTNPDIKVLWNISSDFYGIKDVCSCVMDCEVIRVDPMEIAQQIVERANLREVNGKKLLPKRRCCNKNKIYTEEQLQENEDANELGRWKQTLNKKNKTQLYNEIFNYLDKNLPEWRNNVEEKSIKQAIEIVERAKIREENRENLLPKYYYTKNKKYTEEQLQENKDCIKLGHWKQGLKGKGFRKCYDEVINYLDDNLSEWRDGINLKRKAIKQAIKIVERAKIRERNGENLLPKCCCRDKNKKYTEEELQENKDYSKLQGWKQDLKGMGTTKCYDEVCDYLDENLLGWRNEINLEKKAMKQAIKIVERAKIREKNGENVLPKLHYDENKKYTEEQLQENKDYSKLGCWKQYLKGKGGNKCYDEVRNYLDMNLPEWRDDIRTECKLKENAIKQAIEIVKKAKIRELNGENILPKSCCYDKNKKYTETQLQEHKDSQKLKDWKKSLGEKNGKICYDEVLNYLDMNLPEWKDKLNEKAIKQAIEIVERAKIRKENGKDLLPKNCCNNKNKKYTEEQLQEHKDSQKLYCWRESLKGKGKHKCHDEVSNYLDKNLLGWRDDCEWNKKFYNLKIFIKKNNVRPNKRSENEIEKNLGHFILNQNMNYKTKTQSMKDLEKYKLWTKFLIDNKDILNLKEDIIDYSVDIEDLEENLKEIDEEESEDEEEEIHFTKKPKVIEKEIKKEIKEKSEDEEEIHFTRKSAKLQRQKIWIRNNEEKNNEENTRQPTTNTTKKERTECELTKYHRKFITMCSDNLAQHFHSNRDEFIEYHRIRDENLETFEQNDRPHERIIAELNKIKTKRQKLVVDMGCGLAKIAEYFKNDRRFEFVNYDHVSSGENIIECDIKNMPLEEYSIEICIMSMALWGSNCEEYIREAHRVLETGGKLYIIDSTKRWSETDENGAIAEGTEGEKLKNILIENKFQIINCNVDKWCFFVCEKI
jgi:superfamily II DNA or RNA helicase